MTVGHEDGACVATGACESEAEGCRRGDFFDDADVDAGGVEVGALLDVEFEKCAVVTGLEEN